MDAGRGAYVCGVVLGLSLGFAAAHVGFIARPADRPRRATPLSEDSGAVGELSLTWLDEPAPFRASPADAEVHYAEGPSVLLHDASPGEPARLPPMSGAVPLATHAIESTPVLATAVSPGVRAIIQRELVGSSSAEYDLWCDVLQGLSEEQAAGVLQMWKQGRAQGVTRPPVDHAAPDAGTETSPLPGAATLAPVPTPLQVAGPRPIRLAVPEHESPAAVEAAAAIRAIHAHNLANQQTWGFKRWIPEYQELLIPGETGAWQSGLLAPGAGFTGIRLDMSAGRLIGTGQPLDAAILGDGFFVLKLDNQPVLSRCGSFRLSPERRLALELGTDRWAIVQPEWTVSGEGELTLTEDGRLLQAASSDMAPVEIGRLQLATVPRTASLTPLGGGLFAANARSGEPVQFDLAESEAPGLAVGSLEASNVDADVELERLRWLQECLRLGTQLSARPAGPRAAQVSSESGE